MVGTFHVAMPAVLMRLLACCLITLAGAGGVSGEDDLEAEVRRHVKADRLDGARQLASAAQQAPSRDRALALVALAQAGSASRGSAIETAGMISADQSRAETMTRLRDELGNGKGGGAQADFDSLIDLILDTIDPDSWTDAGGQGTIQEFAGGVFVDPKGVLRQRTRKLSSLDLSMVRRRASKAKGNRRASHLSELRKVSLPRLERQIQMLWAAGKEPTAEMKTLAGLREIQYVLVYPESGNLVLAGPAGDWRVDVEGRIVSTETAWPVLALDDLVVVLRNATAENSRFGCSITPTREALERTQKFLASSLHPIKKGRQKAWIDQIRENLGRQRITVYGIDPQTHAGRTIIEADYRMKLVGMGLEEGVLGVSSYLDSIDVPPGGSPPPMDVLRWWFTLNYDAIRATKDENSFAITGQGVKVLSENEFLTERGRRIHTGKADHLNQKFARDFTSHFAQLAAKYPVYAELKNLFDLALVATLIKEYSLADRVDWHMTHFGPEGGFSPVLAHAPREVDSVVNHRVIRGRHLIVGVSGGVRFDPRSLVSRDNLVSDTNGQLRDRRNYVQPDTIPKDRWWWD